MENTSRPPPPAVDSCLPSFRSRKSGTNYLLLLSTAGKAQCHQQIQKPGGTYAARPGMCSEEGLVAHGLQHYLAAPKGEEPVPTGIRQLVTQTLGLRASWTLTEGTPFREVGKYQANISLNNACSPLREDAGKSRDIWKEEPGLSVWLPRYQNSFTFLYHR